jgi:anti-anti-sigma factor
MISTSGEQPVSGISTVVSPERSTIVLVGEIDAALREQASASMAAALTSGLPIVVDATHASFIDSSGIAFVLQLHLAAAESGLRLTLRDPSRVVRDVLDMVGVPGIEDEAPVVVDDEAAAPLSA